MDQKPSNTPEEKAKRYKGYEVKPVATQPKRRNQPWFWKVLGISIVISALIIAIAVAYALHTKKQQTDYLSKINDSNSLELLLEDHSNITIAQSYTGLKDTPDYKVTRFMKQSDKGTLYSYLKTEGLDADYKEVLSGKNLYRYDGSFTYYYGLVGDDYDNFLADIEGEVLQLSGTETVKDQVESSDRLKVTVTYVVEAGDRYNKLYGIQTGTEVQKVLIIDTETMILLSDVESVNEEEIYTYAVTFDGDNKNPKFYRELKAKKTTRDCTVYYDYQGDKEEVSTFTIPVDTYFTLLDHEGFKLYMDEACTTEFTTSQMQLQNPYTDLSLYLKKDN